jgi:hypothetical protein
MPQASHQQIHVGKAWYQNILKTTLQMTLCGRSAPLVIDPPPAIRHGGQ